METGYTYFRTEGVQSKQEKLVYRVNKKCFHKKLFGKVLGYYKQVLVYYKKVLVYYKN